MICPFCGGKSRIIDCRQRKEFKYRLHVCYSCGRRFSTREYYAKDYAAEEKKPKAFIKGVFNGRKRNV